MTSISSASATPSSSVRQSFDLPGTARSSSPATGSSATANPQRRNRAALRDYYNLSSKAAANSANRPGQNASRTSSISATPSSVTHSPARGDHSSQQLLQPPSTSSAAAPAQFDEPDFDADAYIRTLLQSSDLKTILRVEASLVSEIRNLDGERKALVYDNYSKLITATQTIGNMRKSMDDETSSTVNSSIINRGSSGGMGFRSMTALAPAVEGVARAAQELDVRVNGRGKQNGSQTDNKSGAVSEERSQARNLRKQAKAASAEKKETVRWVLSAPERLAAKLENGKMEEAQRDWDVVRKLLDKWEGVGGAAEIRKECENVMANANANANASDADEEEEKTG